jgi:hypothetical protein
MQNWEYSHRRLQFTVYGLRFIRFDSIIILKLPGGAFSFWLGRLISTDFNFSRQTSIPVAIGIKPQTSNLKLQ